MSLRRTDPTISSPGGAAFEHALRRGALVAGRYALLQPLGRGGHGEVWEAEDRVARQRVAVKLFRSGDHAHAARVRREIAVLRMLRLPGVVSMLDEGFDGEIPFMVMECVDGEPFPAQRAPLPWTALADGAQRLLEIVGRIHAAGVIHRDLKPSNVLVGADGRVTVLDFGLSFPQESTADRLTMDFEFMGTPAYLAPEQLTGDAVGPETDLFAIGVMFYEALVGALPHPNTAIRGMLADRLTRKARPLEELAPSVPRAVCAVVDQLLEIDPAARPHSAESVLQRLRSQRAELARRVVRMGGDEPVREAFEALRAGRSVDVVGATGTGRSRLVDEVAACAEAEGLAVVRAKIDRAPLSTARSLLGEKSSIDANEELAAVIERVCRAIQERARSSIVLIDDCDKADALSQRVFARCLRNVSLLRVLSAEPLVHADASVRLGALSARDIEPIFAGPERLLHVRSEGAQRLLERTDGRARSLLDEIDAWVRAGFCRWDRDGRVLIDRVALDRIALDSRPMRARGTVRPQRPSADPALPAHLMGVAQWLDLTGQDATTTVLVELTREPRWQVEAALDELEARGLVRIDSDRVMMRAAGGLGVEGARETRSVAHRRIALALPRGKSGRFLHLLASGANEDPSYANEVVIEAVTRSAELARDGRIGPATVLLSDALRSVRPLVESRVVDPTSLLIAWIELAIAANTLQALDAVLYEVTRLNTERTLDSLEQLVRAAIAVFVWDDRAASLIEAVRPFGDPRLELVRATVQVLAARRVSYEAEKARVAEVVAELSRDESPRTRARCAQWLGRLAYRDGRFEEAAAFHREAATIEPWLSQRVVSMLDAASASMEAFALEQAERDGARALALAAESRNSLLEGRAEWLLRAVAWRRGAELFVDDELVDAVSALGSSQLEALVCLNEAAIAWGGAELARAAALAERAYLRWSAMGEPFGSILAGSLVHACGRSLGDDALRALIASARACTSPGVGLQALALLADAGVDVALDDRELTHLVAGVAEEHWHQRMELLSVRDALARLRVTAPRRAREHA